MPTGSVSYKCRYLTTVGRCRRNGFPTYDLFRYLRRVLAQGVTSRERMKFHYDWHIAKLVIIGALNIAEFAAPFWTSSFNTV